MKSSTSVRALCAAVFGLGFAVEGACAADMKVKAAPLPAPFDQLDVHGYLDISFMNEYVTGNGLLVHGSLTTHTAQGLIFDIYKDKGGFINDFSVEVGTYNDLWSRQNDVHVGSWNEFDWWVIGSVKFAQYWSFSAMYIPFLFPAHDQSNTNPPATEYNMQLLLAYDDSWTGYPITFNPYMKLWDHISGPSNVVLGKGKDAIEFFLGMTPTIDLKKYWGLPVTLSAPTWFTFGPSNFWNTHNGSAFVNVCGPLSNAPCALSNEGYFSTGLTGKTPLDSWIPKRLGNWYAKYGFQYYHIINQALQAAQEYTDASGIPNFNETFPQTKRDIVVAFGGVGMSF